MASSGVAAAVALVMLRGYRAIMSPLLPPTCRFVPTCSAYAIESVERYGARRGLALAARRLLRCHPWGRAGYDPVPADEE
ncbi:membrane protein insertion efficiency factor YidD [Candidatus Fermentibacteria bacterium]|nr:membrane protein insertion efficiency factor YidD [Candidatus Fermentibacteria bacterium]